MYLTIDTNDIKKYLWLKLRRDATTVEIERLQSHLEKWWKRWPEIADALMAADPQFAVGDFNPLPTMLEVEAK